MLKVKAYSKFSRSPVAAPCQVAGVVTQGRGDGIAQWVDTFRVLWSMDGIRFHEVPNIFKHYGEENHKTHGCQGATTSRCGLKPSWT